MLSLPRLVIQGGTILGEPDRVESIGSTLVPYQVFLEYIFSLGEETFGPGSYDLIKHNCNNFTNEVTSFLCGQEIPSYVLNLPQDILNTPLGASLKPLLDSLSLQGQGSRGVSFGVNAQNQIQNYTPEDRDRREHSPGLEELGVAIEEARDKTRRSNGGYRAESRGRSTARR